MHIFRRVAVSAAATLTVLAGAAVAIPPHVSATPDKPGKPHTKNSHDVACATDDRPGRVRCHSKTLDTSDSDVKPDVSTTPYGLFPDDIKNAYGFTKELSAGDPMTIAIVDAYDDPSAAKDLDTFSNQFGLPTTATGFFTKVNQNGGSSFPAVDGGWALEISLDIEWAHAIAPGAKILLVEASSNYFSDLLAAEDYARNHADYVSNSWGAGEFYGEWSYDSHFTSPSGKTVSFFVSAGDAGLPAEYPSSSPNVISVGGTHLGTISNGTISETGWSDGGGGCSKYETATSAQSSFTQYTQVGCSGRRATPDVSLDADPASGVAVYDSTPYNGQQGWYSVGGTSASSPMWAARAAQTKGQVDSAFVYGPSAPLFRDIVSGNNGAPALTGYDLATGRGSWVDSGAPAQAPPPAPTANFSTSCSNTTCTFTSTSTGVISAYAWSGSGVTGTTAQTSKTFPNQTNTYPVTLTVSNSNGPSSMTHTISCSQGKKNRYSCKQI